MDLVFLEYSVPDDVAQPLDHLPPIHHRTDREPLDGLSNQLRLGNIPQELLERGVGVGAAQLRIEVHDTIGRILRECPESPQPRVDLFLQALTLADVARNDHPHRVAGMLNHPHRDFDRNDTPAAG